MSRIKAIVRLILTRGSVFLRANSLLSPITRNCTETPVVMFCTHDVCGVYLLALNQMTKRKMSEAILTAVFAVHEPYMKPY